MSENGTGVVAESAKKTFVILWTTARRTAADAVFRVAMELDSPTNGKKVGLHVWQSAGVTDLGEEAWMKIAPHACPWALLEQVFDNIYALSQQQAQPQPTTETISTSPTVNRIPD